MNTFESPGFTLVPLAAPHVEHLSRLFYVKESFHKKATQYEVNFLVLSIN